MYGTDNNVGTASPVRSKRHLLAFALLGIAVVCVLFLSKGVVTGSNSQSLEEFELPNWSGFSGLADGSGSASAAVAAASGSAAAASGSAVASGSAAVDTAGSAAGSADAGSGSGTETPQAESKAEQLARVYAEKVEAAKEAQDLANQLESESAKYAVAARQAANNLRQDQEAFVTAQIDAKAAQQAAMVKRETAMSAEQKNAQLQALCQRAAAASTAAEDDAAHAEDAFKTAQEDVTSLLANLTVERANSDQLALATSQLEARAQRAQADVEFLNIVVEKLKAAMEATREAEAYQQSAQQQGALEDQAHQEAEQNSHEAQEVFEKARQAAAEAARASAAHARATQRASAAQEEAEEARKALIDYMMGRRSTIGATGMNLPDVDTTSDSSRPAVDSIPRSNSVSSSSSSSSAVQTDTNQNSEDENDNNANNAAMAHHLISVELRGVVGSVDQYAFCKRVAAALGLHQDDVQVYGEAKKTVPSDDSAMPVESVTEVIFAVHHMSRTDVVSKIRELSQSTARSPISYLNIISVHKLDYSGGAPSMPSAVLALVAAAALATVLAHSQ